MPEAISRSALSQIASYGPPEPLPSEAPAVAGYMAGEGRGLTRGRNEGALACDDLPKKP